jgi:hypothetical protein
LTKDCSISDLMSFLAQCRCPEVLRLDRKCFGATAFLYSEG